MVGFKFADKLAESYPLILIHGPLELPVCLLLPVIVRLLLEDGILN